MNEIAEAFENALGPIVSMTISASQLKASAGSLAYNANKTQELSSRPWLCGVRAEIVGSSDRAPPKRSRRIWEHAGHNARSRCRHIKEIGGTSEEISKILSTIASSFKHRTMQPWKIARNVQRVALSTNEVTTNSNEVNRK
jgi:hypothetical protein